MPRKVQIALGVIAGILIIYFAGTLVAQQEGSIFSQLSRNIFSYSGGNRYKVGDGSVSADQVKNLSIHWIGGGVVIKTGDQDDITFSEQGEGIISADNRMRYSVENGTLTLQHKKSEPWYKLFSMDGNTDKTLTVTLPQDMGDKLETVLVQTVNASASASGFKAQDVRIESVGGKISLSNITCTHLRTDSTSGKISDQGSFGQVAAKSMSASVSIISEACPTIADIETVSGKIMLQISKDNDGFTVDYSTSSGKFDSDFPTKKSDNSNSLIYKNGAAQFKLKTVSGDISIAQD